MPMEKIQTTSTVIPVLWNRGQPGLSRGGEGGNQAQGDWAEPTCRRGTCLDRHTSSGHLQTSSWMGPEVKKWK